MQSREVACLRGRRRGSQWHAWAAWEGEIARRSVGSVFGEKPALCYRLTPRTFHHRIANRLYLAVSLPSWCVLYLPQGC
jgi:hypothetical protein